MVADPVRCQACGVCASVCPANAIGLTYWEAADLAEQPASALAPAKDAHAAVALVCEYRKDNHIQAARILRVPCLARVKAVELLRLFRQGCRNVVLYPCEQEECKYGSAWRNIQSVTDYVRSILGRVWPEARIDLCLPQSAGQLSDDPAGETK